MLRIKKIYKLVHSKCSFIRKRAAGIHKKAFRTGLSIMQTNLYGLQTASRLYENRLGCTQKRKMSVKNARNTRKNKCRGNFRPLRVNSVQRSNTHIVKVLEFTQLRCFPLQRIYELNTAGKLPVYRPSGCTV